MARKVVQAVFPSANLQQFRDLFQSKKEYQAAIKEMDLKERMFSWKPTTELEKRLQSHIIEKALVKVGAGVMKITSYRLSDRENESTAYLSHGGKRLRVTAEGRDGDAGYFLIATQTPEGLTVRVESPRQHYKVRTRLVNTASILLGLVLGIIPGVILALLIVFVEPRLIDKSIERNIWPPLSSLLGARR